MRGFLFRAQGLGVFITLLFLVFVRPVNAVTLPAVGDSRLFILSPTILELSLTSTKQPDPSLVTNWNFVAENGTPILPAASKFLVTADTTVIPVSQVGFRRRPIYAPLKTRDLRIGNSIFLVLASALVEGQKVSVKNPEGDLWKEPSVQFSALFEPFRFNPAIHVNQVGYQSELTKKAMIGYFLGSLGEMPPTQTSFQILRAASRTSVLSGSMTLRRDTGYTYSPLPYQKVYEADFTALRTAGEYVLHVPGLGVSFPFLINGAASATFARTYALGLYHQRCGCPNTLPYTRHEHGVCHAEPASIPTMSFSAVNGFLTAMSSDYASNPKHTAPRLKDVNSSLYPFINTGSLDVSKGHHDAGDYSKYTINSAALIHHLVFAAENFPGAGALDNLGLPESGDGKSDLLQEAKWEADFLAKMQDGDGGFYFLVYPRDRAYEDNVLPDKGDPQVVFPKTTAATAAAVAALAEISSSPRFKAQFPADAARYWIKALDGWNFLTRALNIYGRDGSYQKITHYGDEFMHHDELAWAAGAMFAATGESVYHDQIRTYYNPQDPKTRRWTWWRLFEGYGCAARAYAFAVRSGRLRLDQLDNKYLAKCEAEIIAAGDDVARFSQMNAYGSSFPDQNKANRDAGWYFSSGRSFDAVVAQQIRPTPAYMEAVLGNLNYETGNNPVNISYITGLGWKRPREIVHQYAQNDRFVLPPAGFPLGNIQSGFPYLENYKAELNRLSFPSDTAATAPYPFYDRHGDTFNTTTEFVVVDQARSLATLSYLMAQTSAATLPSRTLTGQILGMPAIIPAQQIVNATFVIPGMDLSQSRVLWEAAEQEPSIGSMFQFTPKNPGTVWVEAEALLPDGTRVVARSSLNVTASTNLLVNTYQSAALPLGNDMVAMYHLDGNLTDARSNSPALTLSGRAHPDSLNLGWMTSRSGSALRFYDLGDKATARIPAGLLHKGSSTREIRLEALVYINSYRAYSRDNAKILSLIKAWNSSLEWIEDPWFGPHIRGGTQFDFFGPSLQQALPVKEWHHLSIRIDSTQYSFFVDGRLIKSVPSGELANWVNDGADLELGNFDGWLDEVVVKSSTAPDSTPTLAVPAAPGTIQVALLTSTSLQLRWADSSTNEDGFRIYRSLDLTTFQRIGTVPANLNVWNDSGLNPGFRYFYSVIAFNSAGESTATKTGITTLPNPPQAPTGVTAILMGMSALLKWNVSPGAFRYSIKRSLTPAGPFIHLASGLTATNFTNSSLSPDTQYYFVITASNSGGESADSAVVTVKTIPSVSITNSAQFIGTNISRGGSWKGKVGNDGYKIIADSQMIPPYVTVTPYGNLESTWNSNPTDLRALERGTNSSRLASSWYSSTSFDVELNFTDGKTHQVSFYCIDWDYRSRQQRVEIIDPATNRILHSIHLTEYGAGIYLDYKLSGRLVARFHRAESDNAVMSGIFFDQAAN